MSTENGVAGLREMLVVVTVALLGLGLAGLVAFTPWYDLAVGVAKEAVVELRAPDWASGDPTAP